MFRRIYLQLMFLASGTVVKMFTKYALMRTAPLWVIMQRVVVIDD